MESYARPMNTNAAKANENVLIVVSAYGILLKSHMQIISDWDSYII